MTLLYGIKESRLFVTEYVETLDLNNKDGLMASQQFIHVSIDFETKKEIS